MRILFVHQNFPGQFKYLAPALVLQGHEVTALSMHKSAEPSWQGVKQIVCQPMRGSTTGVHPWLSDFETKTIRGETTFKKALELKKQGYIPDAIIAHPGWGESLFIKEVWPHAKLGVYCEFFYHADGADVGFDPEFPVTDSGETCRMRLKNLNNLLHFDIADAGISPTVWQASTFPWPFRDKISVIHDGIDTASIMPNTQVVLMLTDASGGSVVLSKGDEIVTFVNRNLEPYRGYHTFMRALPSLLRNRPRVRILIVGGDDVSYGARAPANQSWKSIYINEVRSKIDDADWARVHFLGNVPFRQFVSIMQLSTVHVYLTYPFVLSWSLLEAMSAGCAIVASRTQPLHEVIVEGENGRLVDFFDVDALARQIAELLGDKALQRRLGTNARRFAIQHYDLQTVCLPRQLAWVSEHLLIR